VESDGCKKIVSAVTRRLYADFCNKICHVWTAPGWQELFSRFAALVGAAMCSAF
jgi:hypothetical protein